MSTDGSALGYPELLRLATSSGLQELDSTIVQIPNDSNGHHAVVLAGVHTSRGRFKAVGEAWREALPPAQRQLTVTVAELRAKTRALCEAVGMPQPLAEQDGDRAAPVAAAAVRPERAASEGASTGSTSSTRLTEAEPKPVSPAPAVSSAAAPAASVSPRPAPPAAAADSVAGDAPDDEPVATAAAARARPQAVRPAARPAPTTAPPPEGLGPDILTRLLQMTRRKATLEGGEISEEEAMRKLDSFFQRAFGHPLAEGTRMEGQRVVQRLAADIGRLATETGDAAYAAG